MKIINCETALQKEYVREATASYIGPRRKPISIKEPKDAVTFINSLLKDHVREHFIAFYLDAAHRVVSFSVVSIGTANSTLMHLREVFQRALLVGACALVLAHNHATGELTPSFEDRNVTKKLKDAADLLSIKFLDHIIVGGEDYYSFSENGVIYRRHSLE